MGGSLTRQERHPDRTCASALGAVPRKASQALKQELKSKELNSMPCVPNDNATSSRPFVIVTRCSTKNQKRHHTISPKAHHLTAICTRCLYPQPYSALPT